MMLTSHDCDGSSDDWPLSGFPDPDILGVSDDEVSPYLDSYLDSHLDSVQELCHMWDRFL